MTVYELNRDQLTELKQNYYTQLLDERGEQPSYEELAFIDDYVSDEEIFAEYEGTDFVPDDFGSSAEQDGYTEFGWIGKADEINNILRSVNKVIDTIIDKVRTDERYADLYDSLAAANNELVIARLKAQDIETGN